MSNKTKYFLIEDTLSLEKIKLNEIPENWIYVNFESVIKKSKNNAVAVKQKDYEEIGEIPVVDQGMKLISGFTNSIEHKYTGDLPVVVFGDHTRVIKWVDFDFAQGADGTKLLRPIEHIHPKYFYYFLKSINLPDKGYSRHFKYLKKTAVPLPPFAEQKRIAEKAENLFTKIEEAEQLIEEAKKTFELRRASILDKAFRGELTSEWRVTEKVNFEDWENVNLDEVAFAIDPQPSHRTPPISNDGVPYIGIKECNYQTLEIDFDNARSVSLSVLNEHINRYDINDGDFIIGKIGTVGKPFNIPVERKYVLSANVILIQPKVAKVVPRFLYYLFQSSQIEMQIKKGINATTQAAFGIKKARKLSIILCSLNEQQKIVEILDNFFENEQKSKELIKKAGQFDHLKKTILQNAFRGDLGTNNPSEKNFNEL